MGVRRRRIWLPWLFSLLAASAGADDQGRVAIRQISFRPPVVTAYLDIRDQNGNPPPNLALAALSAKLEGQSLKAVGLKPFESSGEGAAYLFLLDVSKSIAPAQFVQNREFTREWIDSLGSADRMALATFGEDYHLLVDFTNEKPPLAKALATLKPTDRVTRLYLALQRFTGMVGQAGQTLPGRRVIVLLSDGLDEGSNIVEAELLSTVRQNQIPVYAVSASRLREPYRRQGAGALTRIADSSQGLVLNAGAQPVAGLSATLRNAIRGVFVAEFSCDICEPSAQSRPLEITVSAGVPATIPVNLAIDAAHRQVPAGGLRPNALPHLSWWQAAWASGWIRLALVLVIVLLAALAVFWILRKKESADSVDGGSLEHGNSRPPRLGDGPGARSIALRFTAVAAKQTGQEYRLNLTEQLVVGRDQGCDLVLAEDTEISGRHCEITLTGNAIDIADLGSRNGTLLNGAQVVARRRLESGDLIRVGRTELRVTFEEPK